MLWCRFDVHYRVECVVFLVDCGQFPDFHAFGGDVGYLFTNIGLFGDRFVHVNAYGLSSGCRYRNAGRFGGIEFYWGCRSGD